MKKRHYLIYKENNELTVSFHNQLDGYKVKPKDTVKNDVLSINRMVLVKPDFIQSILKKKIKRRLEVYVEYIVKVIEEETDDDDTRKALDDLERYRTMIKNNYRVYLEKKYVELLLKKIDVLESELKKKLKTQTKKSKKSKIVEEEIELDYKKSR